MPYKSLYNCNYMNIFPFMYWHGHGQYFLTEIQKPKVYSVVPAEKCCLCRLQCWTAYNPFSDQKMLLPHGQNEQKGNLCIICIRAQLAQDGMVLWTVSNLYT